MKAVFRGLIVLVVVSGIGYAIYRSSCGSSNACAQLAELCRSGDQAKAEQHCKQVFAQLKKTAGAEATDRTAKCIRKSQSCAAAMGCIVGGGLGAAAGQFIGGFRRALGN